MSRIAMVKLPVKFFSGDLEPDDQTEVMFMCEAIWNEGKYYKRDQSFVISGLTYRTFKLEEIDFWCVLPTKEEII